MPGNSFGKLFTVNTFGESHGPGIGAIVDGCPAGLALTEAHIQQALDRRRPGQSDVTTPRQESDTVEILSGVFEGKTTGVPIGLLIRNSDQRSKDYSAIKDLYRPGHADYTYEAKYGFRDYRGGGRSSGRETACRVAAGAIAAKYLAQHGVTITAYTHTVGHLSVSDLTLDLTQIEQNSVRCPHQDMAAQMADLIKTVRATGDSIGGIVEVRITGCPIGLGDPCFDKLDAVLSHAVMSIGTVKGIEFGDGFAVARMKGSENNDAFDVVDGRLRTVTNHAGGILGGISNGEDIVFRLAVKPPSSITMEQATVTTDKTATSVQVHGRHDPCICPRVVPVVEAMSAIALMDLFLVQKSYQ